MIEKKYIAIIILALVLAMIPACANRAHIGIPDDREESFPTSVFSEDLSSGTLQPPADAKTFLICPDGTAVLFSEISEMYSGNEKTNDKKTLTLSQVENAARGKQDFKVVCEGFAYGYFPEPSFDREGCPERFNSSAAGTERDISTEFFRVKTGDKFGTLTVKNASSFFSTNWNLNGLSNISGAYYSGSLIEYDGEIELTGRASKKDNLLIFYPDGDSITMLPYTSFKWNNDKMELYHSRMMNENWCGDYSFNADFNIDTTINNTNTENTEIGGELIKVKVTLSDIIFERSFLGTQKNAAALKKLEII